jgi:AraC-like DNA-binding protein
MQGEIFNRIIDAIQVKYYRGTLREIIKPAELNGSIEPRNVLVQVNSGECFGERDFGKINPGDFYFMPVSSPIFFRHGSGPKYASFGKDGFLSPEQREQYVISRSVTKQGYDASKDIFSIIGFDVQIYGAIPFFTILELPCFIMPFDEEMNYLMNAIITEEESKRLGRERLLKNLTEELVVHICRFIYSKPEYQKNFEKISYLLDKRLVNIIQYIQNNLNEDLSNQKIAELAYVSKDYIGQFFKSLTNANLQDYIENQRLERAHYLLRTSKDNVQEIAHNVGFKDPAYFSRRFKLKYNKNANQIRKDNILAI